MHSVPSTASFLKRGEWNLKKKKKKKEEMDDAQKKLYIKCKKLFTC